MHPCLRLINERFPHVREEAVRLFESDATFRELCEDYSDCSRTVARLQSSGLTTEAIRSEYATLLLRLERELLVHMEEQSGS